MMEGKEGFVRCRLSGELRAGYFGAEIGCSLIGGVHYFVLFINKL